MVIRNTAICFIFMDNMTETSNPTVLHVYTEMLKQVVTSSHIYDDA